MENSFKPIAPRREHIVAFVNLDPRMNDVRFEPAEDIKVVPLQYVEHSTKMGTSLSTKDVSI